MDNIFSTITTFFRRRILIQHLYLLERDASKQERIENKNVESKILTKKEDLEIS